MASLTDGTKRIKLIKDYQKIAAGEVIERPASVVKELVENSIDAESTQITIIIGKFGKELVQVIDDGIGIPPEDVEIAFQAHTSSKIDSAEDLNRLNTLGFRGEALHSISAISKVELVTKTRNDQMGVRVELEEGNVKILENIGAPSGTNIKIKDIFYNTPVRYKFLKSDRVEMGHITDIITRLILIHPEIHFKLIHNDIPVINSPGSNNPKNAIFDIYGKNVVKNIVEFSYEDPLFKISGFLGDPSISQTTSLTSSTFVNKRYVTSPLVNNAMKESYKDYLMINKIPFFIIFLELSPEKIDFNVHPTKKIIRFENEVQFLNRLIWIMTKIVDEKFGRNKLVKDTLSESGVGIIDDFESGSISESKSESNSESNSESKSELNVSSERETNQGKITDFSNTLIEEKGGSGDSDEINNHLVNYNDLDRFLHKDLEKNEKKGKSSPKIPDKLSVDVKLDSLYDISGKDKSNIAQSEKSGKVAALSEGNLWIDTGVFPRMKLINDTGQLNKTYIVLEAENGFYLMDQHAAAERINYEEQSNIFKKGGLQRQNLLLPITFDVPINEKDFLLDMTSQMPKFGFEIDYLGGTTFAVRSIPAILNKVKDLSIIKDICMEIIVFGKQSSLESEFDKIIKYIACHKSIRAGDEINDPEKVKELLRKLSKCKNPHHCAHGRPIMVFFSWSSIEQLFKRRV